MPKQMIVPLRRFGLRLIGLCMLAMLAVPAHSQQAVPEHLKRALALVEAYQVSLKQLASDELIPLRRLRAAVPTLASLSNMNMSNRLLARYEPKGVDGKPLLGEADMNATERVIHLMADVALSAASMERCIAAIDTQGSEPGRFFFLPIGHAMFANRFLPAPVIAAGLRAVDLIGKPTLSPQEVDELILALVATVRFRRVEQGAPMPCDQIVSSYTDVRLRDDADPRFIIRLDAKTAHTPINQLP
jgi:hypothetical protein